MMGRDEVPSSCALVIAAGIGRSRSSELVEGAMLSQPPKTPLLIGTVLVFVLLVLVLAMPDICPAPEGAAAVAAAMIRERSGSFLLRGDQS
jgi:hypothetical protein